ncbi:MAG: tripartite tricarboxylate transporter permease [Bacteroidales bacterium]|jgi:putative tricarboxylic transport membrane protein|nr:tripartite tricarboxylate transporter permease [Bacteroidales bacterium]
MGILNDLWLGLQEFGQFLPILMMFIGVIVGIMVGVLPGLSPSIGVALMLPVTYGLDPISALVLLVSVYLASNYGGSITAIAINTPGTPGAVATTFDGYELTKQGKPLHALLTSLTASTVGGLIGTVILILFSVPLASLALSFESYEYFALGVFGLTIISSLAGKSPLKGFISSGIGLLLITIGFDTQLPFSRFSMGIPDLADGIAFIPALIGLFALGEIFFSIEKSGSSEEKKKAKVDFSDKLSWKELFKMKYLMLKASVIGTLVGCIPGAGGTIATFIAYDNAKSSSKHPEKFGKGSLEGVAAPEAANNGSVGGALVPLLTLGIPGSASTAVLIGALMIHKLNPGPQLFDKEPGLVYGIFISLFFANIFMFFVGLMGNKVWIKIIAAPKSLLYPIILALSFIGSYFIQNSIFDVGVCIAFGILGWLMKRGDFPTAPVILGLILGKMIEENLRLSLVKGEWLDFFTRPGSLIIIILALVSFFLPYIKKRLNKIH